MDIDRAEVKSLAAQAIWHWKEFCPTLHAELKEAGELRSAALTAAEQTVREVALLVRQGLQWTEAWELTREKYVFLPAEETDDDDEEETASAETWRLVTDSMRVRSGLGTIDGYDEDDEF